MELARELRDRLREDGRHADAMVIDDVLRSFNSTRSTLIAVSADLRAARQRLRLYDES